jgi:hypothetical protein
MPHTNRLSLSLASTAAVALASLPLGITPASAARVTEGTTSSIGVVETSSNASQFNLGNLGVQGASTGLLLSAGGRGGNGGLVGTRGLPPFLHKLLEFLGISSPGTIFNGPGGVGAPFPF